MGTVEEILMDVWNTKGCEVCRTRWLQGKVLEELAVNYEKHSSLHRCEECGTYWEQFERYVDTIAEEEIGVDYGTVFNSPLDN